LLLLPHDFGGAVEGEFSGLAVAAIDEDGFTKGHCGWRVLLGIHFFRYVLFSWKEEYLLNHPRMGTYLRLFLAVTLQ